ncbi:MAG: baseplate J/gp47 family protein, partial [Candidatus Tectomicrobia bacterium]|nr:baseplate J/gp47 family protein [Candidatus Tectomicrobia bacterium]
SAAGLRVQNCSAASGGAPAESPDDALNRVRKALKRPTRTVHADDIEHLALATPGLRVARAKAIPFYHPDLRGIRMPGTVTVVIVPYTKKELCPEVLPKPSRGFIQTIDRFLQARRLLGTQVHITGPDFIRVDVDAHVQFGPRFGEEQVEVALRTALKAFLDPVTGGNDSTGWPFGRTVFKSEIYRVLADVDGVQCVDSVTLTSSETCPPTDGGDIRLPNIGLAYSGAHTLHLYTQRPIQSRAT